MDVSPFDIRLSQMVRQLQNEFEGLVSSAAIAARLSMPPRTARHYLRRAEDAGVLFRPSGARSGYSAMRGAICSLAVRESVRRDAMGLSDLDIRILHQVDDCVWTLSTRELARALGVSRRTVQYRLKKMEAAKLICRPDGARSGYRICDKAMRVCSYAEALRIKLKPFYYRILFDMREWESYSYTVQARLIAQRLDVPARTMRYYLKLLEDIGVIERPEGYQGGYRVSMIGRALLDIRRAKHGEAQ